MHVLILFEWSIKGRIQQAIHQVDIKNEAHGWFLAIASASFKKCMNIKENMKI